WCAARGSPRRPARPDRGPSEPDGPVTASRPSVRGHGRRILAALAGTGARDRPDAARWGLRRFAGPAVRNARGDQDVADAGRRPGGDVDGARDDRRARRGARGTGRVAGHQSRGRHHRRADQPRGGLGGRCTVGGANGLVVGRARRPGMTPEEWIAHDPDPDAVVELSACTADELAARFASSLTFGTAGLRGPMRAGSSGMNLAVVLRATWALAQVLQKRGSAVYVGHDARHGSEELARAAAEVLAAEGFSVTLLPGPLPTPVLAFAVRRTGA